MSFRFAWLGWIIGGVVLVAIIFGMFVATSASLSQLNSTGRDALCGSLSAASVAGTLQVPQQPALHAVGTPRATPTRTPGGAPDSNPSDCFPGNPYGAQVVSWAKRMADALYVNPACGKRRGGPDCNDTYYTSAFPASVIAYGQAWCRPHHSCADWANGSYQCVSFVRGVYSQVYPMKLTNDAFNLWATYENQPGWQEIPAAAAPDPMQRGLPAPGDMMIFKDLSVGHVAIVMDVKAPDDNGKNGWIEFAQANSGSAYDRMPLMPNLLVDTRAWGGTYTVWGYLRPRIDASHSLTRLSQLDPQQYSSTAEYTTWASSACSAAAMTEVLNAYGLHLRIQDVLQVERSLNYITPLDGLTQEVGIAETVKRFGFQTTWGDHFTLDQILRNANAGSPVIVSWPPSRYQGGHFVVVTGGDSATVFLADSSAWDRARISRQQFQTWWGGFAAIVVPG